MIFVIYILLAIGVIGFSVKLSFYVDELDKKTNVSGAFLGGVMLAAVTSLPELFTSISSTIFLDQVNLVYGNILGSNIFNLTIYGCLVLVSTKAFKKAKITSSHRNTLKLLLIIYGIIFTANLMERDFTFFGVSFFSIAILVLYLKGAKTMSIDESSEGNAESSSKLTVKQILIRFVFLSFGLIICSICITMVTDEIARQLNLGVTLAGALLLGIATSLPELTSSIALVKKGNFNAMTGNILGSNLFNCGILFLVDIMYIKGSLYQSTTKQGFLLILFGFVCTIVTYGMLKIKYELGKTTENIKGSSIPYALASLTIVLSYITYVTMSI